MGHTLDYLQSDQAETAIDIGTLVDAVLRDAVEAGASDVHIEPWESSLVVRLRVNGVLAELVHLPSDVMERLSGRFKVMASLVSYQSAIPQEGHAVSEDPALGGIQLRVSIFPTVRGEKIVVRLFDPRNRTFDLSQLGFDAPVLEKFVHLLTRPSGLLFLTGPTGSGKTTAIYAALAHIVAREGPSISISTVEDPVEFNLPMISQTAINPVQDFTYARALRSLMRQDPEVIMIGEVRDQETAWIAVQAGMTGHLVISTIHTNSASGVFARLINMEIEPFLLSSSVIGVLGMRLVRTNCIHCLQDDDPAEGLKELVPAAYTKPTFRRGVGCAECLHTGFGGRQALTELLVVDEVFRDAVLEKLPTRALQDVAVRQGMETLWYKGLRMAASGQTSLAEIIRVVAADTG